MIHASLSIAARSIAFFFDRLLFRGETALRLAMAKHNVEIVDFLVNNADIRLDQGERQKLSALCRTVSTLIYQILELEQHHQSSFVRKKRQITPPIFVYAASSSLFFRSGLVRSGPVSTTPIYTLTNLGARCSLTPFYGPAAQNPIDTCTLIARLDKR